MKHKLLQLIQANLDKPRRFEIRSEGEEATLYLYDVIDDWFGIAAEDFVRQINEITAGTIHLRVNSPGGDVMTARAIQTALLQHPARVVSHIDGLAASAATFIALAGDTVEMSQGGFFMIHKGWTIEIGNADEMRATAEVLDKVDQAIAGDYQRKSGQDLEQIQQWMAEETWFSAQEAKDAGFIDSIYEGDAPANRFDLSAYNRVPEPLTAPPPAANRARMERRLALAERLTR